MSWNRALNDDDELFLWYGWPKKGLISSREHCQRLSPSRVSNTLQAAFEPAQDLNLGSVEWSCAVAIELFCLYFALFYVLIQNDSSSLGGAEYALYNDLFRLKFCDGSKILIWKWYFWIVQRCKIIVYESLLCLPITWNLMINWLNFALSKFCSFKMITALLYSFQITALFNELLFSGSDFKIHLLI